MCCYKISLKHIKNKELYCLKYLIFWGAPKSLKMVIAALKLKDT